MGLCGCVGCLVFVYAYFVVVYLIVMLVGVSVYDFCCVYLLIVLLRLLRLDMCGLFIVAFPVYLLPLLFVSCIVFACTAVFCVIG